MCPTALRNRTKGSVKVCARLTRIYTNQFSQKKFRQALPSRHNQTMGPKSSLNVTSMAPLPLLPSGAASIYAGRSGRRPAIQAVLRSSRPSLYCFHCMPTVECHRYVSPLDSRRLVGKLANSYIHHGCKAAHLPPKAHCKSTYLNRHRSRLERFHGVGTKVVAAAQNDQRQGG